MFILGEKGSHLVYSLLISRGMVNAAHGNESLNGLWPFLPRKLLVQCLLGL